MTTTILLNYEVNEKTMALLPAFHHEYETIALERDNKPFIKQRPLKLIETASIKGGADYKGRRNAVHDLLDIKQKIPIPINQVKQIYAFPTHSPSHIDCCWIFFHHVERVQKAPTSSRNARSIIVFKNGQKLPMKLTVHTLEKQMYRTWRCIEALTK